VLGQLRGRESLNLNLSDVLDEDKTQIVYPHLVEVGDIGLDQFEYLYGDSVSWAYGVILGAYLEIFRCGVFSIGELLELGFFCSRESLEDSLLARFGLPSSQASCRVGDAPASAAGKLEHNYRQQEKPQRRQVCWQANMPD